MGALRRFVNQWRGRTLDAEFDEELRFHLDERTAANVAEGMSPADAAAEARRHLGSVMRAREGMREARISGAVDSLVRDGRLALRLFARQPAATALMLLTLSLGIGANGAIFSLLNASLFRPLPFSDPERLVSVTDLYRAIGTAASGPTIPEALDAQARSHTLEGLSFFDTRDAQTYGGVEPVRVLSARVEPSFFRVLGVQAALGRLPRGSDSHEGSSPIAVLSDGFWRRSFGGDPSAVGRALQINGLSFTIAGVLPAGFSIDFLSPEPVEIFLPYPMTPLYTSRAGAFSSVRRVLAVARVKAGVPTAQASAELDIIARGIARDHPDLYRRSEGGDVGFGMEVRPLRDIVLPRARRSLMLIWGAVGLVLLIACANTAQLLLARAIEREPEIVLRGALGAGRGRLVRQFLAESLLLSAAAGAAGWFHALWLTRALRWWLPEGLPKVGEVGIDLPVLLLIGGVALMVTIACGLLPAWHLSGLFPSPRLDGRAIVASRARARHVLIAAEVAISVVLLVGAGLVVRGVMALQNAHEGYTADGVTVMRMRGMSATGPAEPLAPTYQRYLERINQVSGLEVAALSSAVLPGAPGAEFTIPGQPADAAAQSRQSASYQMVSGTYFDVLRIPLRLGRTFTDADMRGRPPVAIINDELAQRVWPGRSPLGQQIRIGPGPRAATHTIIGVVGNVRPTWLGEDVPQVYVSCLQQDEPNMALLLRPARGAAVPLAAVKQAIWSVVPQQAVFSVRPLPELLAQSNQDQRTIALLLAAFAVLALVMSTAGVYSVVAYVTARRTREIALRRAIGATARDVLGLLAGQTFRWTLAGLAVGMAAVVALSRALASAVEGVTALDPSTVVLVAGFYLAVVAAAMCVPALRALRLDPGIVLRAE